MFPLKTLEEAQKTFIENRLTWFEQNGIVYEYILCMYTKNVMAALVIDIFLIFFLHTFL